MGLTRRLLVLAATLAIGSLTAIAQPVDAVCDAEDLDEEMRIAACSDVIAITGDIADAAYAYNNRGAAYQRLGQIEAAVADFEMATVLDPAAAIPYNNLGLALAAIGDFDRAADQLYRALFADPRYGAAYHNLVLVELIRGRVAAALDAAAEALDTANEYHDGEGVQRLIDEFENGRDLRAEVAKRLADLMRSSREKVG